jgi:thiazole/oxazole-forming peptide maturase SagC family component
MTDESSAPRVALAPSVRLLAAEPLVVRLRWGIWNFSEVTIDLRGESTAVQQALTGFFTLLATGATAPADFDGAPGLNPVERANLQLVVNELRQAGFLALDRVPDRGTDMARVLLGNLNLYGAAESFEAGVGFASDSSSAVDYVSGQSAALGAKVDVLPPEFMQELHAADLTSGMGGLTAADTLARLTGYVEHCDSLVVCISQASILTLRNLNRLACAAEKPVVVGLIDGPFATVVGADSPRTGCLECFEQRSLARLEDHISYHAFVGSGLTGTAGGSGARANGVEALLCAYLVNEAVLLRTLGTSRFIGRALSVYLPTYEMQAQDVLRIATCPACGHVARDISQEINFNSRVVIDRHVEHALGGTR